MVKHDAISTLRAQNGTLYFVALLREELGRRIKAARVAAEMSQRELADAIKLKNAGDISRYERGVVEVPSHRIDLIAEATGRPRSYFTRDPSEPELPTNGSVEQLQEVVAGMVAQLGRIEALLHALADPR